MFCHFIHDEPPIFHYFCTFQTGVSGIRTHRVRLQISTTTHMVVRFFELAVTCVIAFIVRFLSLLLSSAGGRHFSASTLVRRPRWCLRSRYRGWRHPLGRHKRRRHGWHGLTPEEAAELGKMKNHYSRQGQQLLPRHLRFRPRPTSVGSDAKYAASRAECSNFDSDGNVQVATCSEGSYGKPGQSNSFGASRAQRRWRRIQVCRDGRQVWHDYCQRPCFHQRRRHPSTCEE
ncbi:hypothetical protein EDC04DRAFT_348230 [Pisolithus marmoratus]|nr:hypothetical protein EDC04DRAFT_348230 [Pisolithus marmoratus]